MSAEPVVLPARVDCLSALRVVDAILETAEPGDVVVDFGRQPVLDPFGMLVITCVLRSLRETGVKFQLRNVDRHSYAAHIGFLAQFDELYAVSADGVRENERYIAIRTITRQELETAANATRAAYMGDVIEGFSYRLARLLTQEHAGVLVDALSYCLREVIRNSYEHSGADEILVCAQYRPTANRVDLAFADRGVGVLKTLRRNRRVEVESHIDALKVALMPGISGSPASRWDKDNPWANSGYGLFMTHRICREGGVFTMCSGDALLQLSGGRKMERTIAQVGTVVGMTVMLDLLAKLDKPRLSEMAAEGSKIAKTLKGANVTASAASVNLRMPEATK
jgi:hypothetical protein